MCDALFTPRPLGPVPRRGRDSRGWFFQGSIRYVAATRHRDGPLTPASGEAHDSRARETCMPPTRQRSTCSHSSGVGSRRRPPSSSSVIATTSWIGHILCGSYLESSRRQEAVDRLPVTPLSPAAIAAIAEPYGVDAQELYRTTGGNPFFVTEALAAPGPIPQTVRDAVLARAARLSPPARALLEAVAVVPRQVELWLLEAMAGENIDQLDECLASGMLTLEPASAGIPSRACSPRRRGGDIPNRRVVLNRKALAALAEPPIGDLDLTRLAHHAEAAGDTEAVLRFAPEAAAGASVVRAHREAAAQYARALRFGGSLPRGKSLTFSSAARTSASSPASLTRGSSRNGMLSRFAVRSATRSRRATRYGHSRGCFASLVAPKRPRRSVTRP